MVTHPTTSLPACGLSTAERTGSPVFHTLWSIAKTDEDIHVYNGLYSPSMRADNEREHEQTQDYEKMGSTPDDIHALILMS